MINRGFYFLRHGETDENVRKVLQGHLDTRLNATGRQQAEDAADILRHYPIDRIVTSSLQRAVETAEIVNRVLQKPIESDDELRENHFGVYEGLTADEIAAWNIANGHVDGPIQPETGFAVAPGGESFQDMRRRVLAAMTGHLDRYPADQILFVSHGRVFGMLHLECMGQDRLSRNAQPCHFQYNDGWSFDCLFPPLVEAH